MMVRGDRLRGEGLRVRKMVDGQKGVDRGLLKGLRVKVRARNGVG